MRRGAGADVQNDRSGAQPSADSERAWSSSGPGGKAKEGDFTDRRHVSAELRICGWRLNFGAYSLELCELAEVSAKAVARHCNPSRLS